METPGGGGALWSKPPNPQLRRKTTDADAFPHLKRSEHPFGEFTTNRELTAEELERFQVKRVDPEFVRNERVR